MAIVTIDNDGANDSFTVSNIGGSVTTPLLYQIHNDSDTAISFVLGGPNTTSDADLTFIGPGPSARTTMNSGDVLYFGLSNSATSNHTIHLRDFQTAHRTSAATGQRVVVSEVRTTNNPSVHMTTNAATVEALNTTSRR